MSFCIFIIGLFWVSHWVCAARACVCVCVTAYTIQKLVLSFHSIRFNSFHIIRLLAIAASIYRIQMSITAAASTQRNGNRTQSNLQIIPTNRLHLFYLNLKFIVESHTFAHSFAYEQFVRFFVNCRTLNPELWPFFRFIRKLLANQETQKMLQ